MLRLATDEDFNGNITAALLHHEPTLDIRRAQDAGLMSATDPEVLAWAAREGRVLLTHDVNTMVRFAYERIQAGHPMPGVFAVPQSMPIGEAVEDLSLLARCSLEGEWEQRIEYLPLT